jgi:hypothetical protein
MFFFKMFVHKDGNGYDLIKWMQLGGNLQTIKGSCLIM